MSLALNRSSAIRRFEGSDAIKIRDGITFNFYTGLPHMYKPHFSTHEQKSNIIPLRVILMISGFVQSKHPTVLRSALVDTVNNKCIARLITAHKFEIKTLLITPNIPGCESMCA